MTTHSATPGHLTRYENHTFMASIDGASLGDIFKPAHWEKIRREGINARQCQTLNQRLRRRIAEGFPFGMALEELTAADVPYQTRV